jgi:hypothetical protein
VCVCVCVCVCVLSILVGFVFISCFIVPYAMSSLITHTEWSLYTLLCDIFNAISFVMYAKSETLINKLNCIVLC